MVIHEREHQVDTNTDTLSDAPFLGFTDYCIQNEVVSLIGGQEVEDYPKLLEAINIYLPQITRKPQSSDKPATTIRFDVDWKKEINKGTAEALGIIARTGMVRETVVGDVVKLLGVTLGTYVDGGDSGYTKGKEEVKFPNPDNPREFSRILLSKTSLKYQVIGDMTILSRIGYTLPTKDLLKLAIVREGAHEAGHAIEDACERRGISFFERSKKFTCHYFPDSSHISQNVHEELFARFFEKQVSKFYMIEYNGLDPKLVKDFQVLQAMHEKLWGVRILHVLRRARAKGYSYEDVNKLQKALNGMYGYFFTDPKWEQLFPLLEQPPLTQLLRYAIPPYTDKQMQYILGGSFLNL